MKPNIGITEKNLQATATLLHTVLADTYVLYNKTQNAHWNIESSNFMELHKFYEGQYAALAEKIDQIAERIRMLGHFVSGRMKDIVKLSSLEQDQNSDKQEMQIQALLDDHETIIRNLREHIGTVQDKYKDVGTADFMTGLLRDHENMAWMLRSYLK